MKNIFFLWISLLLLVSHVSATPVDEAYRAIPHRKTTFTPSQSLLSASESRSLDVLFSAVDQAIVLRVSALQQLQAASPNPQTLANLLAELRKLINSLSQTTIDHNHTAIRSEILQALNGQHQFLDAARQARQTGRPFSVQADISASPLVRSAHQRLIDAYNKLMALYPQEVAHNRQAFYDHLCALDFL